jgi:hypothetical protein
MDCALPMPDHLDLESLLDSSESDASIALNVHDSSRLEWSATVPAAARGPRSYRLELELELPANSSAPHLPWAQLQALARFERPAPQSAIAGPVDELRRLALVTTGRLIAASQGFWRHARALLDEGGAADGEVANLRLWLHAGMHALGKARGHLGSAGPRGLHVDHERALVDEYLSGQCLGMLTEIARALHTLANHEGAPMAARDLIEPEVAEAIADELRRRRERGYSEIDEGRPADLEGYLERMSQLKKRFQSQLFLRRESHAAEERLGPWIAALAGTTAGMVAFAVQVVFRHGLPDDGRLRSGIVLLALLTGISYALRDRIKEQGRHWLARRFRRYFTQRITRYAMAPRGSGEPSLVVDARESFEQAVHDDTSSELDCDELGPATTEGLRFVHVGRLLPLDVPEGALPGQLRLIFRYDLSPLFSRLHDPVKPVVTVDPIEHRIRMVDAPRVYRLPLRLTLSLGDLTRVRRGILVMNKFGIHRIAPAPQKGLDKTP